MALGNLAFPGQSISLQTNDNTETIALRVKVDHESTVLLAADVVAQNMTSSGDIYTFQGSIIANASGNIATIQQSGSAGAESQPTSPIAGLIFGESGGDELEIRVSGSNTQGYYWSVALSGIQVTTGSGIASPTVFSPSDLPNLIFWADGANFASSSGATWSDQSPEGNDLGSDTDGQIPTFFASNPEWNDLPTVEFNGVGHLLSGTITTTDRYTVFIAVDVKDLAVSRAFIDLSHNMLTNQFGQFGSDVSSYTVRQLASRNVFWNESTGKKIFTIKMANDVRDARENGVGQGTNTFSGSLAYPINVRIGRLFQDVWPMSASFAEVIITSALENSGTVDDVESYLDTKYNLGLL